MLKNYIKVAIRNLTRNKVYTLINLLGLTLGISVFTLLWLFVGHEWSYNKFHSKADRVYRIYEQVPNPDGGMYYSGTTSMALVNALEDDFPEVEEAVNMFIMGQSTITIDDQRFIERNYILAEADFFDLFDVEVIEGDPKHIPSGFGGAVINRSTAEKLFGKTDVVGQLLEVNRFGNVPVSAVFEDFPSNSDFDTNIIYVSDFGTWNENWVNYFRRWDRYNSGGWVLLKENASPENIMSGKDGFLEKYLGEESTNRDFYLQPFNETHLYSAQIEDDYDAFDQSKGNIQYVYIFSAIGIFVLLIACINYINLATARSFKRMKEVGIRKVVGATKKQLVYQFLSESILVALLSVVVAIGVIEFILPYFNRLAGKDLNLNIFNDHVILLYFLAIAVFTGLISGIAPAFIISNFGVVGIFRGSAKKNGKLFSGKGLVVVQFAISIIMIVSTLVVYYQMDFVQNIPLGFKSEHKVIIDINNQGVRESFQTVKNEFLAHPNVKQASATSRVPGEWKSIALVDVEPTIAGSSDLDHKIHFMAYDKDALETYGIKLLSGRNFSGNPGVDSLSVLLNEKAVEVLGLEEPLGKSLSMTAWNDQVSFNPRVIGVVEDFHFQSLYDEIRPLIIAFRHNPVQAIDYFTLTVTAAGLTETLDHVTQVHSKFDEHNPAEINFLDDQLTRFYKKDQRRGELFALAAILAIIIASLGLFGLASYTAQQRTKEFGIRKVLGASVAQIVGLLTKQYAILVAIAFVIAAPIGWYAMSQWLDSFAYRIDLGIGVFALAGLAAFLIAILTVSYRSLIAARTNPVKSLRNE
ncbi:MAG: FtsX-like permease family protein [Cyclobacteriaceae bacterium]